MTLKRAAAIVVIATIAGTPATALACVGWCVPEGLPASVACHHAMAGSTAVGVKDADDTCARLFAVSPFIKEDSQLTARAATPASEPPASLVVARGEAQLAPVRDTGFAVPRCPVSRLVLRL